MNNREGISLICATRDRQLELRRLMESLRAQTITSFELILVDQNQERSITDLVNEFRNSISIVHLLQHEPNNSKARNFGASMATFRWLGFPDDDCWYPADFVEKVTHQFYNDVDGVFVNWVDPTSNSINAKFQFETGFMTKLDAFSLASCICLFLRKSIFMKHQGFNEKLGLGTGTVLKAGEEQELTLRLLGSGAQIYKYPQAAVYHLIIVRAWDKHFKKRIESQGACDFLFTRRFKNSFEAYWLLVTWMAGIVYNTLRMRSKNIQWYWLKLKGALTAPSYE